MRLISNHVEQMQSKGAKTFGHILSPALRKFDLSSSTFGNPVNICLPTVKSVYKFYTSDDCVNPKSLGNPSDIKLITFLQRSEFWKDSHWILNISLSYDSNEHILGFIWLRALVLGSNLAPEF